MANKITCTCGHSWDKSDSSKKDAMVCHICGKDNTMKNGGWLDKFEAPKAQNGVTLPVIEDIGNFKQGVWVPNLEAMAKEAKRIGAKKVKTKSGSVLYFNDNWEVVSADDAPKAQNGIEGTMGGLTDKGFNYNGAWGGPSMKEGGEIPQAQDGWLDKLKGSVLNPENWGVEDYSKEKDFNKAYSTAKKSGEEEFMYKGKRYNTKYAGTPRQEVGAYGVDGKPVHPMDINHPSQVNLYPAFGKYLPGHVSAMVSNDPNSASVNYSSAGNNPYGLNAVKNKGERSYFVYENDKEKLYNKAATLPSGKYYLEDKYTPSDWNLLTNNCADNVCDAFGIPRSKGLETPSGAVSKIKEKYPTIDVTGRTREDYSNLVKNLDQKDVLKNSEKLTSIYFSPDTENELKEDIGWKIQTSLRKSGYDLPKSYVKGNKYNVDKVIGDETLNALKDWKKKNKSLAMGGSLPGAVGFTYARTQGSAPANGKYTKKTMASAQNGKKVKEDSNLENIAEIFDPTGITSWDDIYRSYKETGMSPRTAVEIFGALPFLGKLGKVGKVVEGASKAFAVTSRQKRNAKVAGETLKAIGKYGPSAGIATDTEQTYQQWQNGGEMKFYQEGLDWKPRNISRDGAWLDKYKKGGDIKKDDNGYWNPENWGKPVEIGSNNITMQGVNQPLVGVSDEGDVQYMEPGKDYKFKGNKVTEYPVKKNWLDKYK